MDAVERDVVVELVVELGGGLDLHTVEAALATLGRAGALANAVDDGLASVDDGVVTATQPGTVEAARPSLRRDVHRAIADAIGPGGAPARRRRRADHLVAATLLPDEDVAVELAELAAELRADDAIAEAAERWRQAANLSTDLRQRARRLREAGEALWLLSRTGEAGLVMLEALAATDDPVVRADVAIILGQIELWTRGPRHALAVLVPIADAIVDADPDRAAVLYVHAANTGVISLDVEASLRFAERAVAAATAGTGSALPAAHVALAVARTFHGDVDQAAELLGPLEELAWTLLDADLDAIPQLEHLLNVVGMLATMTERWERGESYLERVAFRARSAGTPAMLAVSATLLAELRFRSGRFVDAAKLFHSDATRGVAPSDAVAITWIAAVAMRFDAVAGDDPDRVKAEAEAALDEAGRLDATMASGWLHHTIGLVELARGEAAEAARHLDAVSAVAAAGDVHEPGLAWWQVDHVEALWRAGRRHDAHGALHRLEMDVARTGRQSGRAGVARSKALLADAADEVEAEAASAIAGWAALPAPFEVARTLLVRAERRLGFGDRGGAAQDVAEATALLAGMEAKPWLAVAVALGERIAAAADPLAGLTEAERRIAEAVAGGLRNKDVAERLFISERTVETHLERAYRKLGVANRTQLAAVVRADSSKR